MESEFWLDRWQQGRTGWQQGEPGPFLVQNFATLALPPKARVFVPLCGATPDIGWLRAQGYAVVGAELSGLAIDKVFDALDVTPQVMTLGPLQRHSAPGIDLFQGDIFDLTPQMLGPVDAVHDRAALFALPPDTRRRYAAHLVTLTATAPQLLTCLDYTAPPDQGPPFSVPPDEVARLYAQHYRITLLAEEATQVFGTSTPARQTLWHLARP
ncbi:MAG: thiopurine S-methyltransferase [Pseudorhodobacter sp.]|nr:thiopurine S-methyltransferase [Pseudorhodobacter sp.]